MGRISETDKGEKHSKDLGGMKKCHNVRRIDYSCLKIKLYF
jgi:hypothetical protein